MNKNEIDKVTSTCICTINENEVPSHNPMYGTEDKAECMDQLRKRGMEREVSKHVLHE